MTDWALILKLKYDQLSQINKEVILKTTLISAALTGLVLASTAAANEATSTPTKTAMGECHGINECKGKGHCGNKDHSCGGQNACKGQGWITMSEKDCVTKKGTWKKSSGMMHGTTKR
ncbi:MAG: hypothetical protein RJB66_889 [Pseudomonadota bacterium]|jgi:hypothetical protein